MTFRTELKERLFRLLMSLLLSFGALMSLLSGLNLTGNISLCLPLMTALCLVLEAASWNRKTGVIIFLALLIALGVFLGACSGLSVLSDIFHIFSLSASGLLSAALPLMGQETALFLTVVICLCGWGSSRKAVGSLPSLAMTLLTLVLLWLGNRPDLMLCLLPMTAASFLLLLLDRHQELSVSRVLPWTAALTALAFLLTPASGVMSPKLREQADALRQTIMDHLFFTEPRDVFSLSTMGYYPEGMNQLGGPAAPSTEPVMQISAPREVYLRGVTLNDYDGRCWKNTLGGRRFLWDSPAAAASRTLLFDQSLPADTLANGLTASMEVSVRMLSGSTSTLFVPQRIRELRCGGELVPYFSNSSEVFITRNLQGGDTWSVSAPLFAAGDPGLGTLVDAAEAADDPRWASLAETYTALPSHLEEPVWQLALDTVSGLDSPYNKAFALQSMLSRSYRYTLDVEEQPSSLDFVTNFLFNTKEGYCTYFASAMTVLCRMAGLPARYVEGFLAEPDSSGQTVVSGLNAHAWTEVYFKGFGWLTFDATPRQAGSGQEPVSSGNENTPEPSPTPTPTPEPEESPSDSPEDPTPTPEEEDRDDPETPEPETGTEENTPTPTPTPSPTPRPNPDQDRDHPNAGISIPWLPLLLLLLLLLAIALRWLLTSPKHKEKRAPDESARFDIWLQECVDLLSARRLTRKAGETPMSWTRGLDASGELPVPLSRLGECVSLLRYGKLEPVRDDTDLARETALALRKDLSFPCRLRYVFRRFLLPRSRKSGF